MATTYRIAVIGSWESVMGFRALGLETYPVTAPEEARETIRAVSYTHLTLPTNRDHPGAGKERRLRHHLSDGAAGKGPAGRAGPV